DPVAAAKFFHIVVEAFLTCLLGTRDKNDKTPADQRLGLLGDLVAHFCPWEAQGRGTLHLHGCAWAANSDRPKEFLAKITDPGQIGAEYRAAVLKKWHATFSECVPGGPITDLSKRKYRQDKFDPLFPAESKADIPAESKADSKSNLS